MGTINVSNLIFKLQQKLNESSTEADILYYSKAISSLKSANIFSVSLLSQLPDFNTVKHFLYYVIQDETLYFASDDGWNPIFNNSTTSLWLWGGASSNKNLISVNYAICSPVREFTNDTNWCAISLGGFHGMSLKKDGTLWTWGSPACGRLGDGTTLRRNSPVREISSSTNWCSIRAAQYISAGIKSDGTLWLWGNNTCGELGDGTTIDKCSPVREISSSTNWCQVTMGTRSSAAVKMSGEIWSWGQNNCGQLGDGTTLPKCSPVREVSLSSNWSKISSNIDSRSAIKSDGTLWTWGRNNYGHLGDGTTLPKCSPVRERSSSINWWFLAGASAGTSTSAAIKSDGSLWTWGGGFCGALGNGSTPNVCSPVREASSSTNWCDVSSSRFLFGAIKTDGSLWAWGCNEESPLQLGDTGGQLGDGTIISKCSPVREISSSTDWCQVSVGSSFMGAIKYKVL